LKQDVLQFVKDTKEFLSPDDETLLQNVRSLLGELEEEDQLPAERYKSEKQNEKTIPEEIRTQILQNLISGISLLAYSARLVQSVM
jgi:hypothetical protein